MTKRMNNIMIDNETLGTTSDAVIMSIGAVRFNLEGDIDESGFYSSISVDSNLEHGRAIHEDTLIWWLDQPAEARKVFKEPKVTLEQALMDLIDFVEDGDIIWSNGASFDIPMLEHAFRQLDLTAPWKFFNSRCVRTYKALPGAEKVGKPTTSHNALRDAIDQARYVQDIHKAVFGLKGKVMA